ncbi:FtsX-like permease family protein [Bacillus sp. 1P06AnD]|uniref:FtsX-like permease family protein n=1 Tax=Bacillus sp. 1P06AnD TaxID=3132208 RepID=UPI0039A0BF5D
MKLHRYYIKNYKKNTAALILSISLTIALIVGMLTLIHSNHKNEAKQNQFIYTAIDFQLKDLNNQQIEKLRDNEQIKHLGVSRGRGIIHTEDNQRAMVVEANQTEIITVSKLLKGRMPENENEIVAEKWALLNLGVNPVIGSEFTFNTTSFVDSKNEKVTYKIVGIINDLSLNKLASSVNLYTGIDNRKYSDFIATIKFKENVNKDTAIKDIQQNLHFPPKRISKNVWEEDMQALAKMDVEFGALLILICAIIIYGVYRISLMAREKQYGVLRAMGMKKKQMRKLILAELLDMYLISIPIGVVLGILSAYIVTLLSKDRMIKIYFWGKEDPFSMVIPIVPIFICIICVGIIVVLIGLIGSRKVNNQSIIGTIFGTAEKQSSFHLLNLKPGKSILKPYQTLAIKYAFRDLKTTVLVILSISIGCILFYGMSYQAKMAQQTNQISKEQNFFNGDYMMNAYDDMSATEGIKGETIEKIKVISGVNGIETQMALPVKVIEQDINRNEVYLQQGNELVKKVYGFSFTGKDSKDTVYLTKLKGYNEPALKKLKDYLAEGSFDATNLKSNEIIIAMPRMSTYGESKGNVGYFKNGISIMQYNVGDTVQLKYRSDFKTDEEAYWHLKDNDAKYTYKNFKIAAIVYYPYMKEVSILEQTYPLLITSEKHFKQMAPTNVYETVNIGAKPSLTKKQEVAIEEKLISLAVENQKVTARSMIEEKEKLDMMYHKKLVYVIGMAVVVFVLVLTNLVNNLKYRIQTRKSELGVYRAIGMRFKTLQRMIYFENMMLGFISLFITFLVSQPIAKYLYKKSEIYLFGIPYEYDYMIFVLLALITLILSYIISIVLSTKLKNDNIMEDINDVE